ncbi:MAG: hypothetical protein GY705_11375 [Bacteroidetes bacterium]|nr:hypothetical protein [Bacteroidota bacterium]
MSAIHPGPISTLPPRFKDDATFNIRYLDVDQGMSSSFRTAELQNQKERAEQSEKFKEMFLANMSHEIRTPMHAISGMTNILLRNKHLEQQGKFLNAIQQSSGNLLVILNDILDLSKIETGKFEIEHIPMNPSLVVGNVVEILRVEAAKKSLS